MGICQVIWTPGDVERIAGNVGEARRAYQTALVLGRRRGLPNVKTLLAQASMALSNGDLDTARASLDDAATPDAMAGSPSHEARAARAILTVEFALRTNQVDEAASALQDAEILQRQSPLVDPDLQWSLERAIEAAQDPDIRRRLGAIADEMERRLDRRGPGRPVADLKSRSPTRSARKH